MANEETMQSTAPVLTPLRRVRKRSGLTQEAVAKQIIAKHPHWGRSVTSTREQLSRWENAKAPVPETCRHLLAHILGSSVQELGFEPIPDFDPAPDPAAHVTRARRVTPDDIIDYGHTLDKIRRLDRKFGARNQLNHLTAHIQQGQEWLDGMFHHASRPLLARYVCDAATLAGWQSLDIGTPTKAWTFYRLARLLGEASGDSATQAHALAESAITLQELGETTGAFDAIAEAHSLPGISPLMAAWLHACLGDAHAQAGHRDDALRAFDTAAATLPVDTHDPELPFIFLAPVHLERWRGHALAMVGDNEAIPTLTDALNSMDNEFVRARTALLVDLAEVHYRIGDYDTAAEHAHAGIKGAIEVGSRRNHERARAFIYGEPLRPDPRQNR